MPLARKLGIREGARILSLGAPDGYAKLLGPLPDDARIVARLSAAVDLVHLFTTRRTELTRELARLRRAIRPDAAVWVSWPKKAARADTDVTEDVIRAVALPLDFVDIKVCAVDERWSGLKLVIRKAARPASPRDGARR
ncbi:MAG TPA: DUF3052 domain-containing protein [Gemmatimonadales bacterium]|nr:DUF3052 domain-containing protein [Gemmatimonadales bacterium]